MSSTLNFWGKMAMLFVATKLDQGPYFDVLLTETALALYIHSNSISFGSLGNPKANSSKN